MAKRTPTGKVSVQFDAELSRRLREESERRGVTMSALMVELIRQAGLDAIAEWEKENGAISEKAMKTAERRMRSTRIRSRKVTRTD